MTQGTDDGGPATDRARRALAAVDRAIEVAPKWGRPDLAAELALVRGRLLDPAFTVLLIGEFKQGKSSLVNALLGVDICPVDDDIATAVPTFLRWSPSWTAAAYVAPASADEDLAATRTELPIGEIARHVTETTTADGATAVRSVEIGVPAPLLQRGLVLVDTPGVGGLAGAHAAVTLNTLPQADAVVFVSDASQEYSAPELDFLATARRLCPLVLGVLTKCDFYPEWRTILELDRAHLARAGASFPILPVSSELRRIAVARGDAGLNAESGFPAVERWFVEDICGRGEQLVLDSVAAVARRVVDELFAQFEGERSGLADPSVRAERLAALDAARARSASLHDGSARWQSVLADGIADLERDCSHDLDVRVRAFYAASDETVDGLDPADAREEYEQWLYRRAAEELAANDAFVQARVRELVTQVEACFVDDGGRAGIVGIDIEVGTLADTVQAVGEVHETAVDEDKVGKAVAGLRGSYGGLMMFGILSKIVGLALVNPVSLVLGGLLTVRTVQELRRQSLKERRHTTKVDGQKYINELAVASRKASADRLTRIRRQLRDRYQQRAADLATAARTAYETARADAERNEAEREARLQDVEAELQRVGRLREIVEDAFAPGSAA